jgi:carbon-monoxide dehydrogenase medium subunit
MKSSPFNDPRATTVDEAISLLARHGESAKLIAGGQSLLPTLVFHLLAPSALIDIGRIAVLRGAYRARKAQPR